MEAPILANQRLGSVEGKGEAVRGNIPAFHQTPCSGRVRYVKGCKVIFVPIYCPVKIAHWLSSISPTCSFNFIVGCPNQASEPAGSFPKPTVSVPPYSGTIRHRTHCLTLPVVGSVTYFFSAAAVGPTQRAVTPRVRANSTEKSFIEGLGPAGFSPTTEANIYWFQLLI